ncbi:MAG: hypothetical protein EBQ89_06295 [Alphaproteobacteria bacterium]|nr:hypothetical protein [Alphaproteobacteria bacterium]
MSRVDFTGTPPASTNDHLLTSFTKAMRALLQPVYSGDVSPGAMAKSLACLSSQLLQNLQLGTETDPPPALSLINDAVMVLAGGIGQMGEHPTERDALLIAWSSLVQEFAKQNERWARERVKELLGSSSVVSDTSFAGRVKASVLPTIRF